MRTTLLLAYLLLSTSGVAMANNIISSHEYVDQDTYLTEQSFEGIRVNALENGNISFDYCYYERTEENKVIKDCPLPIGSPEGYPELLAKKKLFDYEEERTQELLTSAGLITGVVIMGTLRLRAIQTQRIEYFKSGQSFFSGLGNNYLYTAHLPAVRSNHIKTYAWLLGGLLSGKIWLLDDAGEQEDLVKDAYKNGPMLNPVVLIEDFNPEKLADKLSRVLKNNKF